VPAHAAPSVTVTAKPGPSTGPADAEVISGTSSADFAQQVTEVDVSVTANSGNCNPAGTPVTPSCGAKKAVLDTQTGNYTSSWQFPLNGDYTATAVAVETGALGNTTRSSPSSTTFGVWLPPSAPTGVTATLSTDGNAVVVSWKPNPEPDVVYAVVRDNQQLGDPTRSTSVTDHTVMPSSTYQYAVVAARQTSANGAISTAESQSLTVTTPAPPPTTAAPAAPPTTSGGGSPAAGGGTGVPGGTSSAAVPGKGPVVVAPKLDLTSFAAVLNKSRAAPAPAAAALPGEGEGPDAGYNATLPFGAPAAAGQTEDGPTAQAGPGAVLGASDAPHNVRPWAAFGFGVLLAALLTHVLWVRSEINRANALEPLPVAQETGTPFDDA